MALTPAQVKGRIKSIANKNHADARVLMRIYMMDRFLERLAESSFRDNFIIKGGILVTSMVGVSMRSTMDIDASIRNLSLNAENALKIITEVANISLDDGVLFEVKRVSDIMSDMEYPGIRLELDAIMGGMITPIKIDISTGDIITPQEIEYSYHLMIENRDISLWAYNLETILAEKLQTILVREGFNTRMRDFYDVYTLLHTYDSQIDRRIFKEAFYATVRKRKSEFFNINLQLENIGSNVELQHLWGRYQARYTYASDISFQSVMEKVRELAGMLDIQA